MLTPAPDEIVVSRPTSMVDVSLVNAIDRLIAVLTFAASCDRARELASLRATLIAVLVASVAMFTKPPASIWVVPETSIVAEEVEWLKPTETVAGRPLALKPVTAIEFNDESASAVALMSIAPVLVSTASESVIPADALWIFAWPESGLTEVCPGSGLTGLSPI